MNKLRIRSCALLFLGALLIYIQSGCIFFHRQQYRHFVTRTPLNEGQVLVLGFMGGREPWNNDRHIVRKIALQLRDRSLPNVQVETVENKRRDLALQLIHNAFDRNQDGQLDAEERASTRLILYGQSFGGAAVVKLARQLKRMEIPVLLTIQIDSVGIEDNIIPSNVSQAANLFQRNGLFIKGEKAIHPENPSKTVIIGNYQFDYRNKKIDISEVSWMKKIFRVAHTKMEYDPEIWDKVEAFIISEIGRIKKNDENTSQSK